MSFKKHKLKTRGPKKTAYGVGLVSIGIIFIFGVFLIKNISAIDFGLAQVVSNITPETKNNETTGDKINILVTGRGGWDHDAPNLTDTIILASIHKVNKTISMLSIPRDLYVEYDNVGGAGRINEIYRNNIPLTNSSAEAMWALKDKITQITGEDIHYYVNIDFESFTQVVDIFDGVEITLDKNFIDTTYPDGQGWHVTFFLKKWTWTLDGETALKYARSRHSTSDFDRSLRQQKILSALKNKIISNGLLKNSSKIKDLYRVFNKYVETDMSLKQMLSLAPLVNDNYSLISSNLNDSCFYGTQNCEKWGFLYVPQRDLFGGASVLLLDGSYQWALSDYSDIASYFDLVFNKTNIFKENFTINVFNWAKQNFLASTMADSIKKYWFNIPAYNSIGNANKIYENSIIYYNNVDEDSETIQALKQFTTAQFIKTNYPKYSAYETQIEIVLGKDYDSAFNF